MIPSVLRMRRKGGGGGCSSTGSVETSDGDGISGAVDKHTYRYIKLEEERVVYHWIFCKDESWKRRGGLDWPSKISNRSVQKTLTVRSSVPSPYPFHTII